MKRAVVTFLVLLTCGPAWAAASGAGPVQRLAVVVGTNQGAPGRVPLRYAVADAERFAEVMKKMGGVASDDCLLLRDPDRRALLTAFAAVRSKVTAARAKPIPVELLVYFSGHAREDGVLLGTDVVSYRDLRAAIADVGADVGITILDACASGAITRVKGGQTHAGFLSGTGSSVSGYAFLTSSSASEAAQESERLRGSFFTHALLTGLRGAADVSEDRKVTLGEAYQFAFHETLAETTSTQAGAQHPAYDIQMTGTGDVVLTDLRQVTCGLSLSEEYAGRFLILNGQRQLVAELQKSAGRRVELGLEPGAYDVYYEHDGKLLTSSVTLGDGQRQELLRGEWREAKRLPTRARGEVADNRDLLDGRMRVQVLGGLVDPVVASAAKYSLSYWVRRDLALDLSYSSFANDSSSYLLGAKYYPEVPLRVRPHVGLDVGVSSEWSWEFDWTTLSDVRVSDRRRLVVVPGAGIDFFAGRSITFVLGTRYAFGRRSPQWTAMVGMGITFGDGRPKKK